MSKTDQLTPLLLNQQIVNMRKVIHRANVRLVQHLIRQVKKLKQKSNECAARKIARLEEEMKACKELNRDNVSKFALLNSKNLQQLNIRGATPPDQRVVFKMSVDKLVVRCVEEFRKRFPEWRVEVPFLLQRLGLQYQKRTKSKLNKSRSKSESSDKDAQLEEKLNVHTKKRKVKKAVDNLLKNEIKAALEKDSESVKEFKDLLKIRTIKPVELPQVSKNLLPSQRIVRGEAIIKSLDLSKIEGGTLDLLHSSEVQEDAPPELNPPQVPAKEDASNSLGIGEVNDTSGIASGSNESQQKFKAKNFDSGTRQKLKKFSKQKRSSNLESIGLLHSRSAKCSEKNSKSVETNKASTIAEKCNVHPSWAARIREREHLKVLNKVKSKRIVFDDD